jgi:hypothetical protein
MSVFLFVLGAVCMLGGVGAILFGLPVKEFSFGNTLIIAGTTGWVGGLIVIALGAAIAQLQRVVDMLGARPLSRSGRPLEPFEQPGLAQGRVPFPPKPKAQPREPVVEPLAAVQPDESPESEPQFSPPPMLRNPDVPLMAEDEAEELPLSPRHASPPPKKIAPDMPKPTSPIDAPPLPSASDPPWRSSPTQPSYFENMWPTAERSPPPPPAGPVPSSAETVSRAPGMTEPPRPVEQPKTEKPPAAILKSGVVDGMGYTLYVDGSIEAELPDGTLHFASINELRTHLEQNS